MLLWQKALFSDYLKTMFFGTRIGYRAVFLTRSYVAFSKLNNLLILYLHHHQDPRGYLVSWECQHSQWSFTGTTARFRVGIILAVWETMKVTVVVIAEIIIWTMVMIERPKAFVEKIGKEKYSNLRKTQIVHQFVTWILEPRSSKLL